MKTVFISYSRADVEFARRLRDEIRACGYETWLDVDNIRAGDVWYVAIEQGLQKSEIIVGIITPQSLESQEVIKEWNDALSKDKKLFLLLLHEVSNDKIPYRFRDIQRIDFSKDEALGLSQLKRELNCDPNKDSDVGKSLLSPNQLQLLQNFCKQAGAEAVGKRFRLDKSHPIKHLRWANIDIETSISDSELMSLGRMKYLQTHVTEDPVVVVFNSVVLDVFGGGNP